MPLSSLRKYETRVRSLHISIRINKRVEFNARVRIETLIKSYTLRYRYNAWSILGIRCRCSNEIQRVEKYGKLPLYIPTFLDIHAERLLKTRPSFFVSFFFSPPLSSFLLSSSRSREEHGRERVIGVLYHLNTRRVGLVQHTRGSWKDSWR